MKTTLSSPRATSAEGGFTLIELLTVIAIIGILAAIIIPTVGQVRKSAFKAKSTSNLRQLSMAATAYANEHKGLYPSLVARDPDTGDLLYDKPWTKDSTFAFYLSINKPDWKPGDGSVLQSGFPASPWPNEIGRATIGYNATDFESGSSPYRVKQARALKQGDIVNPSRLLFFGEAVDYRIVYGSRASWKPANDTGELGGAAGNGMIAYRAGDKSLIVTYAGNVRSLSRTEADEKALWSNYDTTTP